MTINLKLMLHIPPDADHIHNSVILEIHINIPLQLKTVRAADLWSLQGQLPPCSVSEHRAAEETSPENLIFQPG